MPPVPTVQFLKIRQFTPQLRCTSIRNLSVVKVQCSETSQFSQVDQAGIRNVRRAKEENPEVDQFFQMRQTGICNFRLGEDQLLEAVQSLQMLHAIVGNSSIFAYD